MPYTGFMRKTSVYLDDALAERLARLARELGRSQADVLRNALASYEPASSNDREFAIAAGFARVDGDDRPLSQESPSTSCSSFGA